MKKDNVIILTKYFYFQKHTILRTSPMFEWIMFVCVNVCMCMYVCVCSTTTERQNLEGKEEDE